MKGYDVYRFDLHLEDLLHYAYSHQLNIYRLNKNYFYSTYH